MKDFTVVIETTVNPLRDMELDTDPETKSHWYDVQANTEIEAKNKAKQLFYNDVPHKGIWSIDVL